jgi:hypothetical protein
MAESATSVGSLTFLELFAMFSLSPRVTFYLPILVSIVRTPFAKLEARLMPPRDREAANASAGVVRYHPGASYWQGDAKEMAAIKTILIIVNSMRP